MELERQGQSYGEPSFHRVRWSRAGPSERLFSQRCNLSNANESSSPRTQSKPESALDLQSHTMLGSDMSCMMKELKQSCNAKRKEKSKAGIGGMKISCAIRLWNSRVLPTAPFPILPLNNNSTERVRNANMVSLLTLISRDARTEMSQLVCQRHFTNAFKYS